MAEETTESFTTNGNFVDIPTDQGESVYPYSKVEKTLSGHQFETDDSWGNERIKRTHCTGTSETFMPDGSRVVEVMGDDYTVVIQDKTMFVKGELNIVVLEGDAHITSNNDLNITAHGNLNMNVAGDRTTRIGGNDILEVTGDIAIRAGEEEKAQTGGTGNLKIETYGNYEEKISGTFNSTINKKAAIKWNWTGESGQFSEEPPISKTDGYNEFNVGKHLSFDVSGRYLMKSKELDIRATEPLVYGPNWESGFTEGIYISCGSGVKLSAGTGDFTIDKGDLNLTLGDINLVLGSINTGYGSITAATGNITAAAGEVLGGAVKDTGGNVLSGKENTGHGHD